MRPRQRGPWQENHDSMLLEVERSGHQDDRTLGQLQRRVVAHEIRMPALHVEGYHQAHRRVLYQNVDMIPSARLQRDVTQDVENMLQLGHVGVQRRHLLRHRNALERAPRGVACEERRHVDERRLHLHLPLLRQYQVQQMLGLHQTWKRILTDLRVLAGGECPADCGQRLPQLFGDVRVELLVRPLRVLRQDPGPSGLL